ncbi:unnamed protein product [Peniophora sp. CBMAI 1063]|nr:unnamed protein product [Peniophora sp. CBMAI 1063]
MDPILHPVVLDPASIPLPPSRPVSPSTPGSSTTMREPSDNPACGPSPLPHDLPPVKTSKGCGECLLAPCVCGLSLAPQGWDKPSLYLHPVLSCEREIIQKFLQSIPDKAGNPPPVYWPVTDVGNSLVGKGTLLVLPINRYADCYGRAECVLQSDLDQVLLELRVLGWNTFRHGLKAPDGPLTALAAVSHERLTALWREEAENVPRVNNVTVHALSVLKTMHGSLEDNPSSDDPVTSVLLKAFKTSSAMQCFNPELGTVAALVRADRLECLGATILEPPVFFDPSAAEVRRAAPPSGPEESLTVVCIGPIHRCTTGHW